MPNPVVSSSVATDAPSAQAPASACCTRTHWRIWGRRRWIKLTWADDQPFPSTGSLTTQTIREPSGPSRRTLMLLQARARGSSSLYAAEVLSSSSV